MKTIFFIFLAVYIIASALCVLSVYNKNNRPYYAKSEMYNEVFECAAQLVFLGGVIFCLWSVAMWFNNMW